MNQPENKKVDTNINFSEEDKTEKAYTIKGITAEIERAKKSLDKKQQKLDSLTEEVKDETAKLKKLETIYDNLQKEALQKQMAKEMTVEQINKLLELSRKINIDEIDLDKVEKAVKAVNLTQENDNTPKKVDTNINFLERVENVEKK